MDSALYQFCWGLLVRGRLWFNQGQLALGVPKKTDKIVIVLIIPDSKVQVYILESRTPVE